MRRGLLAALRALVSLAGVWVLLQLVPRWLPGDPARVAAGEWAPEPEVAAIRHLLRLDLPAPRALAASASELAHGSLGQSLRFHRPVAELLACTFPVSLTLAVLSLGLSLVLATLLAGRGRKAAWARSIAIALPVYVAGPLLLWAVALRIPWIPVAGVEGWTSWILPSLALALPLSGHQARILSVRLEELRGSLGLRVWEAAGIPASVARRRWILPAVAGPWFTVVGLQLGALLGGAVLTETIFGIPGLGQQLVSALAARDLPLLQGTVLLGAALYAAAQVGAEELQVFLQRRRP